MTLERFEPEWLTWGRLAVVVGLIVATALGVAAVRIADVHVVIDDGTPAVDTSEGANATEMVVDASDRFRTTDFRAETTVTLVDATVVDASNPPPEEIPPPTSTLPENRTTVTYVRGVDHDDRTVLLRYEEHAPTRRDGTVVRIPYRRHGGLWLVRAGATVDGNRQTSAYFGDGQQIFGYGAGAEYERRSEPRYAFDDGELRRFVEPFHDPTGPWQVVDRRNGTVVLELSGPANYYDAARIPSTRQVQEVHEGSRFRVYVDAETGYITRIVEHRIVTVRAEYGRADGTEGTVTQRVHYRAETTFEYHTDTAPPEGAPGPTLEALWTDLLNY